MKNITINNLYLHNLKGINVTIPKHQFVAVTGVSGSGKSSLVMDTLFAESEKRYMDLLKSAQSFHIKKVKNVVYDSIKGLCPVIGVEERKYTNKNPRSIIGTQTKMYKYLRILYTMLGNVETGEKITDGNYKKLLNFNSQEGMCLNCLGRGYTKEFSWKKIVPSSKMTLSEICSPDWVFDSFYGELEHFYERYGCSMGDFWEDMKEEVKTIFLEGDKKTANDQYQGVIPFLTELMENGKPGQRMHAMHKADLKTCSACHGKRLSPEGLKIKIKGLDIFEAGNLSMVELKEFLMEIQKEFTRDPVSQDAIQVLLQYIESFQAFGMGYVSIFRNVATLSGGEYQRLMIISHIFYKMNSVIYIFDEPSQGLHALEKKQLASQLRALVEYGNTVIVIEHDQSIVEAADYIIDMGPFAGKYGGQIVYKGAYSGLLACEESVTGQYFSGKRSLKKAVEKEIQNNNPAILIKNACTNNLKNLTVSIPLGHIVGVAGVSGSGKSTLIQSVLVPALQKNFMSEREDSVQEEFLEQLLSEQEQECKIEGMEYIEGYSIISQAPLHRNKKSIVLTFTGIWDEVLALFSSSEKAIRAGLKKSDFSMNGGGGCPLCKGSGLLIEEIGDVQYSFVCPECKGNRYRRELLVYKVKEKSIVELLDMEVEEGICFFDGQDKIVSVLKQLKEFGLGHLKMGQSLDTLSGGEGQRLKLTVEFITRKREKWLYLFDEPTAGLSSYDREIIMDMIRKLNEKGNSVLLIEHDLNCLRLCDYILELGQGGGKQGGNLIASGSPAQIRRTKDSLIGRLL